MTEKRSAIMSFRIEVPVETVISQLAKSGNEHTGPMDWVIDEDGWVIEHAQPVDGGKTLVLQFEEEGS